MTGTYFFLHLLNSFRKLFFSTLIKLEQVEKPTFMVTTQKHLYPRPSDQTD